MIDVTIGVYPSSGGGFKVITTIGGVFIGRRQLDDREDLDEHLALIRDTLNPNDFIIQVYDHTAC